MRVHLMPRGWSSVVRLITRSMTMLKNSADIKQPCLTPVLTSKLDLLFCNLHVKLSKKLWMTWTICCGIPWALGMAKDYLGGRYQRLFRNIQSYCTAVSAILCTAQWCFSGCLSVQCIPSLSKTRLLAGLWSLPGSCLALTIGRCLSICCSCLGLLSSGSSRWRLLSGLLVAVFLPYGCDEWLKNLCCKLRIGLE